MESKESEEMRWEMTQMINSERADRAALEAKWGQCWDTQELQRDYQVIGFAAPFVVVLRKSDGQKGSLMFQHMPRYYFQFQEAK